MNFILSNYSCRRRRHASRFPSGNDAPIKYYNIIIHTDVGQWREENPSAHT